MGIGDDLMSNRGDRAFAETSGGGLRFSGGDSQAAVTFEQNIETRAGWTSVWIFRCLAGAVKGGPATKISWTGGAAFS
jgi:hypothetical protein